MAITKELNDWIDNIVTYSMYCRQPAKARWIMDLESFAMNEASYNPEVFQMKKECYSIAAEIIKMIFFEEPWDAIKVLFNANAKNSIYVSMIGLTVLKYSDHETEFIEQVVDLEELDWLSKLYHEYEERKLLEDMKKLGY
ncbi:MAG: hypothetical protein J1F35_07580 [Erysipelotrichales bacterium]|nr:hypothetical protein [Erysipelotrichales bacterium]